MVFVSSFTSTAIPSDLADVELGGVTSTDGSTIFNSLSNDFRNDNTERVSTLESTATPTTENTSALSQVGNVIFQLLGEEGYNSFSCNLTTASEDDATSNIEGNTMYRRINETFKSNETVNGTLEKIEFQPVESNSLPEFPQSLRDDQEVKYLLLEFNILEICNFTSKEHDNWIERMSKRLTLCSNGISKIRMHVNGKAKLVLEKYLDEVLQTMKKFKVIQESKMKIIKIINLTDYLSSTIKDSDVPKDLKNNYHELKQFLLVELKNEDLSSFHPDSNRKDVFMTQLFEYLLQSKIVDSRKRKLLEMFKKYIRIVS